MIAQVLIYLPPAYVVAFILFLVIAQQVIVRTRYAFKVKAAGGIHAPMLAKDPVTGSLLKYI